MSGTLEIGKWNVICDRCGGKQKSDEVTKTWDGLIVCKPEVTPGCFEHRHPQDFVRPVTDNQSVPFVRAEPTDQFVDVTYISESVGVQERTRPTGTGFGNGT
jgi:hypothetical protein